MPPVSRLMLARAATLRAPRRWQQPVDGALEVVGPPTVTKRERDRDRLRITSGREAARIAQQAHELLADVQLLDERLKHRRRPLRPSRFSREQTQRVPAAVLTPVLHRLPPSVGLESRIHAGADVCFSNIDDGASGT